MSPFLKIEDEGNTYALQTAFPNYKGIVQTIPKGIIPIHLTGYHLYLNFNGTLSGNMVRHDLVEAKAIMNDMARWFLYEVIMKEERWEKFKM